MSTQCISAAASAPSAAFLLWSFEEKENDFLKNGNKCREKAVAIFAFMQYNYSRERNSEKQKAK